MRNLPGALLVALCLVVYATPFVPLAHAGERLLGVLIVSDGGTVANPCTKVGAYKVDAGPFYIAPRSLLSVQCDFAAHFLTDVAGVDAGTGIELAAGQFFTTSVGDGKSFTCKAFASDAGIAGHNITYYGGWVAIGAHASSLNSTITSCRVYDRSGLE